jgi:hypothetical protein
LLLLRVVSLHDESEHSPAAIPVFEAHVPKLQETTMTTKKSVGWITAAALALATTFSACGGSSDDQKGQGSLEVYAELTQSGIAAITQMQNGQLIIGYHPFYLTPTSVQIATLNADHKSSTPYPPAGSGLLQSCRNPDGSWLPAVNGRYDFCIDWVLGFHADANGILWILDGAKSTGIAKGADAASGDRPRCTPSTSDGTPRRTSCSRSSTSTP